MDPAAADDPANKLNALIDTVHGIWRDTAGRRYRRPCGAPHPVPGATQMVFSDLGTEAAAATRGFSAYAWIRERLVGLGATRLQRYEPAPPLQSGHIVMQDPEGNEFCLD